MVSKAENEEICTQIEYYMGDKNLGKDKFFREQIMTGKDGYISISHFLNCNKVQKAGWTKEQIAKACVGSKEVEVKGDTVRRAGNSALPTREERAEGGQKKRDEKAQNKAPAQLEDEYDANGRPVLVDKDFENPIIVSYEAKVGAKDDFKADWKQVEKSIRETYPKLKLIYSRMEQQGGQLAFSQLRLQKNFLDQLFEETMKIEEHDFKFHATEGDDLKKFWQEHGGHFNFCIQNKIRQAKKAQKIRSQEKRETVKRAKTSFEIAGVYYLDINKVKSKSRAILNLKQDGERIEGNDSDFLKELLALHEKKDAKMKDFDHFEVGTHPDHEKTRCFFVVRKDEKKEDFSITKCIMQLEQQN